MKYVLSLAAMMFLGTVAFGQNSPSKTSTPDPKKKVQTVEASCGQCNFGMKEKRGCDLAARFDDKAYFVEGTRIDEHGDAHAEDGFCEKIRQAEVQGEVKDGKFKVSYFKLLPLKKED